MLDIKYIRNNADLVRNAITNKNEKADIAELLFLDEEKKSLQFKFDNLRAEQNKVSKEIPKLKKAGQDVSDILLRMKGIAQEVKELSAQLSATEVKLQDILLTIPNIPHPDVPLGGEENNQIISEWGEKKDYSFQTKDHIALAEQNNLLDLKRAAKLSGSGFAGYTGQGAMLERALINFMLDFHINKHGYTELALPYIVNRPTMTGTGQLPKLEDDMYHIDEDDLFLIPTAEVPVTNFHADEIISHTELPKKFVAYSSCFRREAGSYGKDTKGLQRLHQFNKVEMVRLVKPQDSYQVLQAMVQDAADILQALDLHYRVVTLASGDLSFAAAKTIDIEVWAPGAQKYLEVSSISNFEDFQARRASIRYRGADDKVHYLHTLNGSGLATPRTFIALIETHQNSEGKIMIPPALRPYLGGREIL
ncbi:MAG: serine--tRNA ligase [Candidatus Cloacimonadales bacterium]